MSFAEGTRFTTVKHADQQSPYQHLLQPKSGGLGMALSTIGELFTGLVDVTLVYPNGTPSFVDAMSGRLGNVVVVVRQQHEMDRMFWQDVGRAFYTDRPSRLTPEPVPY